MRGSMRKTKVLIVDDEEYLLRIMKINLERTGAYEVLTLSDGTAILPQVHSFQPQIILLDLIMPKIDGMKVCQKLKEDSRAQNIPVIIISALDTDEARAAMRPLGVVDFIEKPVEHDKLVSRIEKALQQKE